MKKAIFILILCFSGIENFAQTKSEQITLNNIKRFFTRLKSNDINTKEPLLWIYTYGDTSITRLEKLSLSYKRENLKIEEIKLSKYTPGKYELRVSEIKKHNPESLNERLHNLNLLAEVYKVLYPDGEFSAEVLRKYSDKGEYKKVKQ